MNNRFAKKKIFAVFVIPALITCIALSGCGGTKTSSNSDTKVSSVSVTDQPSVTEEPGLTDEPDGEITASPAGEVSAPADGEVSSDTSEKKEVTDEPSVTEEPEMTFTDVSETVWATANVNIRVSPDTSSEILAVLYEGESVMRTGIGVGWSRVSYDGGTYYISSDYLSAEEPKLTGSGHVVAIDAGHQAHSNSEQEPVGPGAAETKAKVSTGTQGVATGAAESQLNLTVSLKLKEELLKRGYQVVMIRETQDVDISNAERALIANESGAEIFLRIHANGDDDSSVNGIITMSPSSSNPYISYLYNDCYRLSSLLVNCMCAATGANNLGVMVTDSMTGINWCTIPVSIIEVGFMSNPEEDVLLNSSDYQDRLVQGMADAVDAYFGG